MAREESTNQLPSTPPMPQIDNVSGLIAGTPVITIARPLAMSPPWMHNEMRHRAVMTPPSGVVPEAMVTPEVEQTFRHVSTSMNANFVLYCMFF